MSDQSRPGEIAFADAREQFERACEMAQGGALRELPRFEMEKGAVRIAFSPAACTSEQLFQCLAEIKRHIENIRIHTMEPGYVIFQAMGANLYDTDAIPDGIKFRFSTIGNEARVEVTRKGALIQEELSAAVAVYRVFGQGQSGGNARDRIEALGARYYGAEDAAGGDDRMAGYKRTRIEIRENVILPLKNPELLEEVARLARGGSPAGVLPRAVLFEGPPGVGKTTMARLIARETGVPMVYIPIESVVSKYYGESAQNLTAMFDAAASLRQAVIFIDEIDSLAGSREGGLFEATRRVLSVLLRKIDGFEAQRGILTVGATNRAEDLDPALLSRFDRRIHFGLPDATERAAIFATYAVHLQESACADLAERTEGASGRNIRDICQYAERRWARQLISKGEAASPPPAAIYADIASGFGASK